MLYPEIDKCPTSEDRDFFKKQIKPKMPKAISMGNDEVSGNGFNPIDIKKLSRNVRTLVLRNI